KQRLRHDILDLMATFPDPSAIPLLKSLLNGDDPEVEIPTALLLYQLGDKSGVPIVVEKILEGDSSRRPRRSNSRYLREIHKQVIGSPEVVFRLVESPQGADDEKRARILQALTIQSNASHLPLYEDALDSPNAEVRKAGLKGIERLIRNALEGIDDDFVEFKNEELKPLRMLLKWAFDDESIMKDDGHFPDYHILGELEGALLAIPGEKGLFYDRKTNKIEILSKTDFESRRAEVRGQDWQSRTIATGGVGKGSAFGYLMMNVSLNHGGESYLFKKVDGEWKPIASLGGWIS
ncbi:MAG: hypothetical protein KC994_23905, partial [Candidatus Omnitrophica bacterium]|nr:hypothetical protein [Candidatus Omnitrophota bacterium]